MEVAPQSEPTPSAVVLPGAVMSVSSSLAVLSMVTFAVFVVTVLFRDVSFGVILLMVVSGLALVGSQLRGHFVVGRDGVKVAFFQWNKVYLFRHVRAVERHKKGMVLLLRDGGQIELETATLAQRGSLELVLNQAWNTFAWNSSTKSGITEMLENAEDWSALTRPGSGFRDLSLEESALAAIVADVTATIRARIGAAVVLRALGYAKLWELVRGVIDSSVDEAIRVPLDRLRRGATNAEVRALVELALAGVTQVPVAVGPPPSTGAGFGPPPSTPSP